MLRIALQAGKQNTKPKHQKAQTFTVIARESATAAIQAYHDAVLDCHTLEDSGSQ